MIKSRCIELAKQGNYKVIATLLNDALHPENINANTNFM